MEYRQLGRSGLKVSALSLGTMTFGGKGMFAKTGATDVAGARRQIDLCLDAGVNLFDTADVYSDGLSEEILGEALEGRRDDVLIATKARFCIGAGPNDAGSSRLHLIAACEASLKRLRTDHIDLYQLHQWDGLTPLEETLEASTRLVRSGKVRYIGVSNFSAWHLMKTLAVAERATVRPPGEPADPLHPAGPRGGIRAGAGRRSTRGSASWSGARSPAACSPASTGAATSRRRAPASSPTGASRRSATRRSSTTSSKCWSASPRPAASRPPRSRSPGCWAGRG